MNKSKELTKNTLILMSGKICTQFITFLLLPLYTSILSTEDYGIVDLVMTYVALLAPALTLQLGMAAFRFLVDNRNDSKNQIKIISNTVLSSLILLMFVVPIIIVICKVFNLAYTMLITILVVFTAISEMLLQIARGLGYNFNYSIACIILGVTNVLLNILFLAVLKLKVEGMFLSQIIANLLCIVYLDFKLKIHKRISIKAYDRKFIKRMLRYSMPLVPNGIMWWIMNVSDRTLISLFINTSANGIYAISNKFSNLLVNLYNIYNMSWTESVSLHLQDNDDFINNIIKQSLIFFSSICALLISFMPIIFKVMINEEYIDAYKYIPILLIATLFNISASLLGAIYIGMKDTKKISLTSFLASILNVIINFIFIKKMGIYAAALSTLISFMAMSIYRYYDIKKSIKIKLSSKRILTTILLYMFITICYYINNIYVLTTSMIITIIYVLYYNKNIISFILRKMKLKK